MHVQRGDNPHPTSPLLSYACTERGQPPTPPHPCPLHLFCCELLTSAASISLDSGFLFPQFGESPRLPLGSPSPRALGTCSLQLAGNYGTYFVRLFSPRNYCPGDWGPVSCRLLFLCVPNVESGGESQSVFWKCRSPSLVSIAHGVPSTAVLGPLIFFRTGFPSPTLALLMDLSV